MIDNETVGELSDYEEDDNVVPTDGSVTLAVKKMKGGYASMHSSSFRDFLLKPELQRAIADRGFEHPSEGKIP